MSRSSRALLAAALVVAALAAPSQASGAPYIQAHRGGSIVNGVPTYPENSMPAFRHSANLGFTLELDTKLTADGVPVVFHDADLDRVTPCTGPLVDKTYAELRASCPLDILGSEGNFRQLGPNSKRGAPIPKLSTLLKLLRKTGASASIEIKNIPTDDDFDATNHFATVVSDEISGSGVPPSHLIIQSFWPANLIVAKQVIPGAEASFLTLANLNPIGAGASFSNGWEWASPQWPVDAAYISQAHSLGRKIVPFTIDTNQQIAEAATAGVDAIITNDPVRARRILKSVEPVPPTVPKPPTKKTCRSTRAKRNLAPIISKRSRPGAPRVFAMQFKQAIPNVTTYRAFRTKIECMIRQYVKPHLAHGKGHPNVVVFNEDVGLMTLAAGSRGETARTFFTGPNAPGCEGQGFPCAALGALSAIGTAYVGPLAAYKIAFPSMGPFVQDFVAPTDTLARGWMQTFSDMARRYGIYIVGSNTQAPFRESRDPSEIAIYKDPDKPTPQSVYVATNGAVYNQVFMWGPHNVRSEGPRPLLNVVATNRKVPVTPLESALGVSDGPKSGPDAVANLKPYRLPGTKAKVGFATSLPAFKFGSDFGDGLASGVDPCEDTSVYYMHCLDRLGANLVLQDEANPGSWAAQGGQGAWQPLEWMGSTWRHAADPSVSFAYNVTPFMTGNLADLPFDGQSAITQRAKTTGKRCTFIGNARRRPADPAAFRSYAGKKRHFIAIAPWVRKKGGRKAARATAAKLAPGSGDKLEDDYVETAIIADLPFPGEKRRGCLR